jgi:hypothetical protein
MVYELRDKHNNLRSNIARAEGFRLRLNTKGKFESVCDSFDHFYFSEGCKIELVGYTINILETDYLKIIK